ncbi:MAG TPA: TIGR03943 family protein [Verrucomicrobiae bacterium]|nr:TIGR03943 family protein [Verrucomicrobiae bacterium]
MGERAVGVAGWRSRAAESLGSLTLVCWGAVFLAYFARGDLVVFVAPFFRPLIAAAGAVLAAIGFGLCLLPRGVPCCHPGDDGGHDLGDQHDGCQHHGHSHGEGLTLALIVRTVALMLPLVLLFSVRPEGFSATTVRNRGIMRAPPPTQKKLDVEIVAPTAARPDAGPRKIEAEAIFTEPEGHRASIGVGGADELTVYDIMVFAADPEMRQKMEGARVRVLGQMVHDAKKPGSFDLVRMFIVCCAADARVLGLRVDGSGPAGVEEMEWIQVDGKLGFQQVGPGIPQPFIRSESIEKADEPDEPFLY